MAACPDVEVARDAEYEQPVEGVQAAVDRMVVGEPGEQALHERGQQDQYGGQSDRAGTRPGDGCEHKYDQGDASHCESEGAVGSKCCVTPGDEAMALEAKHA